MKLLFDNKTTVSLAWNTTKVTSLARVPAGTQRKIDWTLLLFYRSQASTFKIIYNRASFNGGNKGRGAAGWRRTVAQVVTCFSWQAWPHSCPLTGRRKLRLTTWSLARGGRGQTGRSRGVLGAMKNNFLLKMGLRGTSLARSRGLWATQEEFQGGVTENVRGKCQRQTAASGCCTPDLFTQYLIKLHHEGIPHPERTMNQTTGIKSLMCVAEMSRGTILFENHLLEYIM